MLPDSDTRRITRYPARYALEFLDAYLKQDPEAMGFLKKTAAENGVPLHTMTVSFRAAKGAPATFEALRVQAGAKGFDHLAEAYAEMKKEKPDFKIGETPMYIWATDLKDDGHLAEAIDVLKLQLQIYPDSSDGYEGLGEAYQRSGRSSSQSRAIKRRWKRTRRTLMPRRSWRPWRQCRLRSKGGALRVLSRQDPG